MSDREFVKLRKLNGASPDEIVKESDLVRGAHRTWDAIAPDMLEAATGPHALGSKVQDGCLHVSHVQDAVADHYVSYCGESKLRIAWQSLPHTLKSKILTEAFKDEWYGY